MRDHNHITIYSSHVNAQADDLRPRVPRQLSPPQSFTFSSPVYLDTHQVIRELEGAGIKFEVATCLGCGAYCSVVPSTPGYSVKQAEALVAILNQSLQSSVTAATSSQLSQRELVSLPPSPSCVVMS